MVCAWLPTSAAAAEITLGDIPFWKANAGWWASDNTYFDGALNYNIRAYNSIVHIEIDGRTMRETEYKFFTPGKLAQGYGAGKITADEGIEVVTVTAGEQVNAAGTVRITRISPEVGSPAEMTVSVLGPDTGVRVIPDASSGVDSYRMFITLPAPDKRYVANFGIVSKTDPANPVLGDLRGFSLFRGSRIAAADFEKTRTALRERNKVHATLVAGPDNKPQVLRLD